MVMLYRASSLPMMAVLHSNCLSLSCNILTFHAHIFGVSFRPQLLYWMTSPPRFADKSDWDQLFLGNLLYSLLHWERAVLPQGALTSWQDTYGNMTPMSMTIRPSHQGRQRAES